MEEEVVDIVYGPWAVDAIGYFVDVYAAVSKLDLDDDDDAVVDYHCKFVLPRKNVKGELIWGELKRNKTVSNSRSEEKHSYA